MVFNFDRVVAYGCSFTAGQELADSIVLGRSEDEIDAFKRKEGIHCHKELYGTEEIREKCNEMSSKISWPNYVAEKMGIPCINRAKPGTGINEFIFNIERDLATGKITDTDLILVGLTSVSRFSWIRGNGEMQTKFIGDPRWNEYKNLNDALLYTWATENNLMWEYIKCIRHLDLLSNKLGGRLKMLMCVFSLNFVKKELSEYRKYLPWLDDIKVENLLIPSISMSTIAGRHHNTDDETHGWGHPKLRTHKEFAELAWSALIASGAANV